MAMRSACSYPIPILLTVTLPLLLLPGQAEAIPPPEFMRMGGIFIQALAGMLVLLSTAGFLIRKRLAPLLSTRRAARSGLLLCALLGGCMAMAWLVSTLYEQPIAPPPPTARINGQVVAVAGMEFDIADPALAISPKEASPLLGSKGYLFIDIREPVEFETRHIPGFVNLRAGDLLAEGTHPQLDREKTLILACEAGERGSAIAVFLKLRGYRCRYLDGGIRGWLAANLPLNGSETMQLPDFPNKYLEISAAEAEALYAAGKIVPIDVRAPSEFAQGHVRGALNLPLMNMSTDTLDQSLEALPRDRAVLGVAYDRFGAYYSLILGHMLAKRGRTYAGTLTIAPGGQAL